MRLPLVILVVAAGLGAGAGSAYAQREALYHGVLSVRSASGPIDRETGNASLRVKNWEFRLSPESNGIAPDKEPIKIRVGDGEEWVIPVGAVRASRNGKRFVYRNSSVPRGIRAFELRRLKDDPSGLPRYRVRFSLADVNLSTLVIAFPVCTIVAVFVGEDDGFTGVEFDRPGGFKGSRVRALGACTPPDWPWD